MRFRQMIAVAGLMLLCAAPGYAQSPTPLTAEQERALKPKDTFRECENCPEMVVVPAGAFTMGAPASEWEKTRGPLYIRAASDEGPQHVVIIGRAFAVGRLHVTRDQFAAFVQETGYAAITPCNRWAKLGSADGSWRDPGYPQEGSHPVVCVTWNDAKAYVDWLSEKTNRPYHLLSEAEWEYAARGRTRPGSYPRFWFGNEERDLCRYGNGADQKGRESMALVKDQTIVPCNDGYAYTSPAGHYKPNAFGLYDMAGNAWQWTEDCYHGSYDYAPDDGSAWTTAPGPSMPTSLTDFFFIRCKRHVFRGGAWNTASHLLRAAARAWTISNSLVGFRVARTLTR